MIYRFSQEDIDYLKNYCWNLESDTAFVKTVIQQEKLQKFFLMLKNYNVIEIGPGKYPLIKFVKCRSYSGIQPDSKKLVNNKYKKFYINQDGLSFLRKYNKINEEDTIVVSFGVIDNDVLNYENIDEDIIFEYIKDLVNEIKKVKGPFMIICADKLYQYLGEADVGFQLRGLEGGVYFKK